MYRYICSPQVRPSAFLSVFPSMGPLAVGGGTGMPVPYEALRLVAGNRHACSGCLDKGLHVSGERNAPCRGGIHAARQLSADTVCSFRPNNTDEEHEGGIYPAPTINQDTPLPSHTAFHTKRNGHARSLRPVRQLVGNRHACSGCLDKGLHASGELTAPCRGGIHAARQLSADAVRSFRPNNTDEKHEGGIYPAPTINQDTLLPSHTAFHTKRNGHARSLRPVRQLVGNRHACSICLAMGLHASGERNASCRDGACLAPTNGGNGNGSHPPTEHKQPTNKKKRTDKKAGTRCLGPGGLRCNSYLKESPLTA